MKFVLLLLVLPIALSFVTAFFLGREMKRRCTWMPKRLRLLAAAMSPIIAVLGYFWIFQQIDFAMHKASGGGSDYMGPMAILLYGGPLFGAVFVFSCFLASYRFLEA